MTDNSCRTLFETGVILGRIQQSCSDEAVVVSESGFGLVDLLQSLIYAIEDLPKEIKVNVTFIEDVLEVSERMKKYVPDIPPTPEDKKMLLSKVSHWSDSIREKMMISANEDNDKSVTIDLPDEMPEDKEVRPENSTIEIKINSNFTEDYFKKKSNEAGEKYEEICSIYYNLGYNCGVTATKERFSRIIESDLIVLREEIDAKIKYRGELEDINLEEYIRGVSNYSTEVKYYSDCLKRFNELREKILDNNEREINKGEDRKLDKE